MGSSDDALPGYFEGGFQRGRFLILEMDQYRRDPDYQACFLSTYTTTCGSIVVRVSTPRQFQDDALSAPDVRRGTTADHVSMFL